VRGLLESRSFMRIVLTIDLVVAAAAIALGIVSLTRPLPLGVWLGFGIALGVVGFFSGLLFLATTSDRRE
jgi:hypothetical protein